VKRCRICGETKPLDDFYKARGTRDGRRGEYKKCNLGRKHANYLANREREIERVLAWRRDNRERYNATQRAYATSGRKAIANRKSHLKRKYGLTPEQYDAMLAAQGGVCFICRERPGDLPLHVDHDHRSGEVRKLLCVRCNNALGLFAESPELFTAAAEYLERHDPEVVELHRLANERARALSRSA
jgi:hypothetical protein